MFACSVHAFHAALTDPCMLFPLTLPASLLPLGIMSILTGQKEISPRRAKVSQLLCSTAGVHPKPLTLQGRTWLCPVAAPVVRSAPCLPRYCCPLSWPSVVPVMCPLLGLRTQYSKIWHCSN